MDVAHVDIEFRDAHITFRGVVVPKDGTPVGVDEMGSVEHAQEVDFTVHSDGMVLSEDGATPLLPGDYMLNGTGLYRRLDGRAIV